MKNDCGGCDGIVVGCARRDAITVLNGIVPAGRNNGTTPERLKVLDSIECMESYGSNREGQARKVC